MDDMKLKRGECGHKVGYVRNENYTLIAYQILSTCVKEQWIMYNACMLITYSSTMF